MTRNKANSVNIRKTWFLHFSKRLILAGSVLVVCMIAALWWVWMQLINLETNRDFARSGLPLSVQDVRIENGIPRFDPSFLEQVKQTNGWLQVLDEQGNVTYSRYAPPDVPDHYAPGELVAYWLGEEAFPYDLYLWIRWMNDTLFTLLYGVPPEPEAAHLLNRIREHAVIEGDQVRLPASLQQLLVAENIRVQVIDREGREQAVFRPDGREAEQGADSSVSFPSLYTPQELALRAVYPEQYSARLAFDYDPESGVTWIIHKPFPPSADASVRFPQSEITVLLTGFIGILVVTLLFFLLLALWYGYRFGTPILHMMNWLEQLSRGHYAQADTRLSSRHRPFASVFEALQHLTKILKDNENMRDKMEKAREEWISGVTHDLKTPLSSVKGYAHMLEAPNYEWSREEIREFASTIGEKAAYMEALIEDLNLAYRLQNDALPLHMQTTNLHALLRETIRSFQAHPRFADSVIELVAKGERLSVPLDERWFRRALENVLANAVLHNPPGTRVRVSAGVTRNRGWTVKVEDDGQGMDGETLRRLFDRYYRGTNTEDGREGSGLGMAIARQIIRAHGGEIRVFSEPGKGTVVSLLFPVRSSSAS